jgi:hypothetical protein
MNTRVQVVRSTSALDRQIWEFIFIDSFSALVLDSYKLENRPSKRHKNYSRVKSYSRLPHNMSFGHSTIQESEVPWPEDVQAEALATLISQFRVVRWERDLSR